MTRGRLPHIDVAALFGDNLARVRRAGDVSQDELAIRSSVHRTEISQLERGLRVPRIDTLAKLMASLETSADELMKGIVWVAGRLRRGRFGASEGTEE